MDLSNKPARNPDFRLEEVDGDLMLFHPAKTDIHYLNPSAVVIWQLCDGTRTIADMVLLLQETYPDSAGEIRSDVLSTLKDFEQKGCVGLA